MDLLATGSVHLFYWYPFTNYSHQLKEQGLFYSFFFSFQYGETEVQKELKRFQVRSPNSQSSSKRLFFLLRL